MGKVGKSRKRARRQNDERPTILLTNTGSKTIRPSESAVVDYSNVNTDTATTELNEIDIEITETTLQLLLNHPTTDLLKSPAIRKIRTYAYAIVNALGTGKTTIGRISDALHDNRWLDAIDLLSQHSNHDGPPPLGALQRWIRDIFESTILINDPIITYKLLYYVLICTGQTSNDDDTVSSSGSIKVYPMWYSRQQQRRKPVFSIEDSNGSDRNRCSNDDTNCSYEYDSWIVPKIEALTMESAWRDGMTLWSCRANDLLKKNEKQTIDVIPTRCNIPFVPGAFILNNVLSSIECDRILKVANAMGFTPEAFYSLSSTDNSTSTALSNSSSSTSNAADGVVWIVPECLLEDLFERVKLLLPSELCGGKLIHLNSRWRIYRYTVGTVYRPHIDGAWSGSGVINDVYVNDIYDGKVISRLTFLLYLNDNFEQGGTTFYSPSHEEGCVVARSIAPIQGSILCFPHGPGVEHVGLVHEGSAVTNGTKYVMRSDVLYEKI